MSAAVDFLLVEVLELDSRNLRAVRLVVCLSCWFSWGLEVNNEHVLSRKTAV